MFGESPWPTGRASGSGPCKTLGVLVVDSNDSFWDVGVFVFFSFFFGGGGVRVYKALVLEY